MWILKVIGQKMWSVSCAQCFIDRGPKLMLSFDPITQWPKINRILLSSSATYLWSLEVIKEKSVVCIVSTRSYTQSAKVDLDLWPRDPKSIGFLLSSSTSYMRSLKVIRWKVEAVSCPQGKAQRTHSRTASPTHSITQPHTNGRITISPPTLLRGDNIFLLTASFNTTIYTVMKLTLYYW